MKKIIFCIFTAAAIITLATGCGKRVEKAEASASTAADTAATPAASTEKQIETPTLEEIVNANKLSVLLDTYTSIYIDTEYYLEDGVMSHLSQYWKKDEYGPVGILYQTDPTEEEPFYEYMSDGRDYRKEYDGSLTAQFSSSPEALKAYHQEIDDTCSPLLTIGDETMKSCALNGSFFDLETNVNANSLTSAQKEAYEITSGRLITKARLDAKDLHVISLDTFREDADGTLTLLSKMTLETNTEQPDLPYFMKEFESPEEIRTITLIFNKGTSEENQAVYTLPKDAGFYPAHEESYYDIFGDAEKKITFDNLLKNADRGADLTLYLFKK